MQGDNVYNLNRELFKVLNMIKGIEVEMNNPRKGLIIQYEGKVFRLEAIEMAGVDSIEKAFKIIPN